MNDSPSPPPVRALMYFPWSMEQESGAHLVLRSYADCLARTGMSLDLFAPCRPTDANPYPAFERFFGPPTGSAIQRFLELAGQLHQDEGLPFREGCSALAESTAATLAASGEYGLLGVHYTRCAGVARMTPSTLPKILFTYDLDTVVASQECRAQGAESRWELDAEAAVMRVFDLITVLGPWDERRLLSAAPDLRSRIVEAPFCPPLYRSTPIAEHTRGNVLWISSNVPFHRVSFEWFWHFVWPLVCSAEPACRLLVVGRICDSVRQLRVAEDRRVSLFDYVADTEPIWREADLLAAPYYFGDGVKTKVLEAMSRGVPVVTSRLGLSNTRIVGGRHVLVSDNAEGFAGNVVNLIRSADMRRRFSASGRSYIKRYHRPETALAPLRDRVIQLLDSRRRRAGEEVRPVTGHPGISLPGQLRRRLPEIVELCRRRGINRVAVYGAGTHTRLLLPIWADLDGPEVSAILVTDPSREASLMGRRIVPLAEFDPACIDAVLLSSHTYESIMERTCARRWPGLPVLAVWDRRDSSGLDSAGRAHGNALDLSGSVPLQRELPDHDYDPALSMFRCACGGRPAEPSWRPCSSLRVKGPSTVPNKKIPPRLLIVDPNMKSLHGHYFGYARRVAEAAARMGVEPFIVASTKASLVSTGLRILRSLDSDYWEEMRPHAGEDPHDHLSASAERFAAVVACLSRELALGSSDVMFFPCANVVEAMGLARIAPHFGKGAPRTVLLFRREIGEQGEDAGIGPRAGALILRQTLSDLFASPGASRFRLLTDTEALTEQYREATRRSFQTAPIPVDPGLLVERDKPAGRPWRLVYLGDARTEKGYLELPALAEALNEELRDGSIQADIQSNFNLPHGEPGIAEARARLESWANVRLLDQPLPDEVYIQLLRDAHLLLLPYQAHRYSARSSGILAEAVHAATPVVVPAGTWMSEQLVRFGAGVIYEPQDELGLPGAVRQAMRELPSLLKRAVERRSSFVAFHNPERLAQFVCGREVLESARNISMRGRLGQESRRPEAAKKDTSGSRTRKGVRPKPRKA